MRCVRGCADTAIVDRHAAITAAHRQSLKGPPTRVGPQPLDHEQRDAVALAVRVVADEHTIGGGDVSHASSNSAIARRTDSESSAAARGSPSDVPSGGTSGAPTETIHGRSGSQDGPPERTATGYSRKPIVAAMSPRGASPAPTPNHDGANGAATKWPARSTAATSVSTRPDAAKLLRKRAHERKVGRGDDARPPVRHPVHRGGEHQGLDRTRTAVRDEQRRPEPRDARAVADLDTDAIDHRVEDQVLQVRIAAELVDRVSPFDAAPKRVDERISREQTVGVDPEVRNGRALPRRSGSCSGLSGRPGRHRSRQ